MKRIFTTILSFVLSVALVLPMFVVPVSAATYIATGTLNTKVRLSDYETDSIDGQTHTPRKYHFYDTKLHQIKLNQYILKVRQFY